MTLMNLSYSFKAGSKIIIFRNKNNKLLLVKYIYYLFCISDACNQSHFPF